MKRENAEKHKTKIKICGLTREEDILCANQLKPHYVGLVFAKSRRRVTMEQAVRLKKLLDPDITAVGVFVDEEPKQILEYLSRGIIDAAQLHGNESEGTIRFLRRTSGKPVIKAVVVRQPEDILKWKDTEADYLLLDSGKGSGETFRWSLMEDAVGESEVAFKKRIFLAGGIHPGNIHEAIRNVHPYCIDVSSGAETDGVKDPVKMKALVESVRNVGM